MASGTLVKHSVGRTASASGLLISALPSVSVVIPARNEEATIGRCLQSLKQQDYQGPWEVVVVDNSSTDRTAEVALSSGARVIHCPQRGVVHAREAGFRAALGDVIVQTDADCQFRPDWLSTLVEALLSDPSAVAAAGEVDYQDEPAWHHPLSRSARAYKRAWYQVRRRPLMIFAANLAVWRTALTQVGGYGNELPHCADERLLLEKLWSIGRVVFAPEVRVSTSSRRFKGRFWQFLFVETIIGTIMPLVALHVARLSPARHSSSSLAQGRSYMVLLAIFSVLLAMLVGAALYGYLVPSSSLFGKIHTRGRVSEKLAALTFDDGPHETHTPQVIRILAERSVRATFFLQGFQVSQHPEIVRQLAQHGHELGNHLWSHPSFGTPEFYRRELLETQEAVRHASGVWPALFRPPYGRKTPWLLKEAERQQLATVGWTVSARDPANPPPAAIVRRVVGRAKPGAIILLHDGASGRPPTTDRSHMIEALPDIISQMESRGYRFVTVSELLALGSPRGVPA